MDSTTDGGMKRWNVRMKRRTGAVRLQLHHHGPIWKQIMSCSTKENEIGHLILSGILAMAANSPLALLPIPCGSKCSRCCALVGFDRSYSALEADFRSCFCGKVLQLLCLRPLRTFLQFKVYASALLVVTMLLKWLGCSAIWRSDCADC